MNNIIIQNPNMQSLRELVLSGRNANTIRSYAASLADFTVFLKQPDSMTALETLLAQPPGTANAIVAQYRASLLESKKSANTINSRIGAIRSIVKDARRFGLVTWKLDVPGVKSESYRDTRGPGKEAYRKMLEAVSGQPDGKKRRRDLVIIRMLHDLGLRRKELCGIDLSDVDVQGSTVTILGKGRTETQKLTVPPLTMALVVSWIELRGNEPGPLIVNLDRNAQNADRRLSGKSVYTIVQGYGAAIGVKCRPHGLRHRSVTALLEMGASVQDVRKSSIDKKLETLMIYDDNRKDVAGDLARRLSEE